MKVLKLNTINSVSVVLRTTLLLSDNITLRLRNESTDVVYSAPITWVYSKDRIVFDFETLESFKEGEKYEMELLKLEEIVYRGKAIVVKEDTDIQNYTPSKQQTQRFKTKA